MQQYQKKRINRNGEDAAPQQLLQLGMFGSRLFCPNPDQGPIILGISNTQSNPMLVFT